MTVESDRKLNISRAAFAALAVILYLSTAPARAEEAYASTGSEYAQAATAQQQQPLHQQQAPAAAYRYQQYEYTDNDAAYQPYRAPAGTAAPAAAPVYQNPAPAAQSAQAAPAAQQPIDNDAYYSQYAPAAGGNYQQQQQQPATVAPRPLVPQSGNTPPANTYSDNDASYNASKNHFYDPMYDY